jgi:hypothetical protein
MKRCLSGGVNEEGICRVNPRESSFEAIDGKDLN